MNTEPTPEERQAIEAIIKRWDDEYSKLTSLMPSSEIIKNAITEAIQPFKQRSEAAEKELAKIRDPIREHFGACLNCEPIMCCNGAECGCQAMPVDFKPTMNCTDYCLNKVHHKLTAAQARIKELEDVLREIDELKNIPKDDFEDVSVFDESTYRGSLARKALRSTTPTANEAQAQEKGAGE